MGAHRGPGGNPWEGGARARAWGGLSGAWGVLKVVWGAAEEAWAPTHLAMLVEGPSSRQTRWPVGSSRWPWRRVVAVGGAASSTRGAEVVEEEVAEEVEEAVEVAEEEATTPRRSITALQGA